MYKETFEVHGSMANTLSEEDIGTHKDGWTINGDIKEDHIKWVNDFKAIHPTYGKVWGDFEKTVRATSKKAYLKFLENHYPHMWDYDDI